MNWFNVSVYTEAPYPIRKHYRMQGSTIQVVAGKAARALRVEPDIKGKRLGHLSIKIDRVTQAV